MKIKVLLVMPGKEVQIMKTPASIKFIKAFIGDELYEVKLNENTLLIANKKAKIDEFNRILNGDILLGTFVIITTKKNRRISMNKKNIQKFTNMFKLNKHQKKIERYKDMYLEEYYCKQRALKQKNVEESIEKIVA